MSLCRSEALGVSIRLLLWGPVLIWLGWLWQLDYAHLVAPLYREVLSLALGSFQFADIELVRTHEHLFKAAYITVEALIRNLHVVPAGLDGYVQAPVYYALIHPIVLGVAAMAWPGLSWQGRLTRLLVSVPVLIMLEVIDVPLVMYSSITDAIMQTYDPRGYTIDKPFDWIALLEGGGRIAFCLAAAFLAAWLHELMSTFAGKLRKKPHSSLAG